MTKSFKKRLNRIVAVLMAVAMLVGTLPADLLGGIASVSAAEEKGTGDGGDLGTGDGLDTWTEEVTVSTLYNFLDESIVTGAMDGKTPAVSVDGKLTVASSASSTFKRNGGQHGVAMAKGGTVTIKVDGDTTFTIGGCQHNNGGSIQMNGVDVVADTKTTGCPVYQNVTTDAILADANCFTVDYEGEAGEVVLTFNGTNYVPYIVVSSTKTVVMEKYTSVYNFTDGSIIPESEKGVNRTETVTADGKLTLAGTHKYHNDHGVGASAGLTATIAVNGDTKIVVGACQYSADTATLSVGDEVIAESIKTTACSKGKTDLADNDETNSITYDYEGEAGEVVLTFGGNGSFYLPHIIVSGTREVPPEVTATVTLTGAELLQPGDEVTLTNSGDPTNVVDVTEGGEVTLNGDSIYSVAVSNSDIAASIAGKTLVATTQEDLAITIDLVPTVVRPVVTFSDPGNVLGEAVITLTNMADGTEVHTLTNGESVKLKIGASYLVASSVAEVAVSIAGKKTLAVDDKLAEFTVDVTEADLTHHTIDVWDFGVEELANTELITYKNNLTPALVLAWYDGLINAKTGEAYKAGDVVPSNVLGWDANSQRRVLDAGAGLRLDGEQSKANKWRHRGISTLDSIPNERNESTLVDEYGVEYKGIMYSNAGTTAGQSPYTWFELDVTAGDIVWAVVSSNGTDSVITFESPSGDKQTFTFTRASRTLLQNTEKFYAAETGTYKLYSANEKIVVARIYKETPNMATVSGSVTVPEGKDITGVSIVFTNDTTGQKTLAPIVDNAYSVELSEQYSYSLSLEGVNDVIVGLTNGFELKNEQAELTYDVNLVAVELLEVSGSLADLTAEDAANLKLTFSSEEIYVPAATIDAANQTYTAKFEKGVTYTVSEAGVNDYTLDTKTASASENNAVVDLKFTKKPVYAVNVTLNGPSVEEAANVALTFTNINEEGYVYSFTGTTGIALRDGQYAVTAVLDGYAQKVTSDVKVNGAAVDKTITMLSTAAPDAVPYKETITVGATGCDYTTINAALAAVRLMEREEGQRVTIAIEPGDYQEMLVVDVPNVTLKNTNANASIVTKNKGVDIDDSSVRITSYYGHGYTYYSMGADYKYDADVLAANQENGYYSTVNPGSGTGTYWNATVEVHADGFRAEGIIFENSFNQYVSELAAQDTIVPQGGAKGEKNGARNELEAGDTRVQAKAYVERAAALGIGNDVKEVFFDNCSFIGRQDTLYGGTNSTVAFYDCDVYGGTDYIFGGMIAVFAKCDLVLNTDGVDKNDVAYITAAQQKSGRGYLMYNCNVVGVQPGVNSAAEKVSQPGYFGRPWEAVTSEATFFYTVVGTANDGTSLIAPAGWNDGLGGKAKAYEYGTYELTADTDNSASRVNWSNVLTEPVLPDGAKITVPKYLGSWKAFEGKDMTIEIPGQNPIAEPTDSADDALFEEDEPSVYVLDATADLTAMGANDANAGKTQKAGTNKFFELTYSAKSKIDSSNKSWDDGYSASQRINFGGAITKVENSYQNSIKFTVKNPAEVRVWWVQGADPGSSRQVAILSEAGAEVAVTEDASAKNAVVYSKLKIESAGTYYLGNIVGSNYLFRIEVEEEKVAGPIDTILDATADLTAMGANDANAGKTEKAGTDDFFELTYSAKSKIDSSSKTWDDGYTASQRINFGGAITKVENSYQNSIKFTTEHPATVKVWWVQGADPGSSRQVAILSEAGAEVAVTEDASAKNATVYSELSLENAGTYYLGNIVGSNYLFKIQVTQTPGGVVEVPRADWATVAGPEITSVVLNPEDSSEILVTVAGLIGHDGADRVDVDMIDEKGDVVDSKGSAKVDTTENVLVFVPSESGSYSFVARMSRTDEDEVKVCAETEEFAFTLPLSAPIIKSITNKGLKDSKGTLEVAWTAVTEARSYEITVSKEVAVAGTGDGNDATNDGNDVETETKVLQTLKTTAQKIVIEGLEVGDYVTVSIVAVGVNGKSKARVANATVKADAERTWAFAAYGSSIDLNNNGFINNEDGSVTVYSESGKGKVVPGSTDGLAYYYTTIDPTTENFTMTVDVHVDKWKLSNGQDGFGIMVADAVGESGDGTAFWNNSYQLFATKIEYNWDTVNNAITTATAGENGVVKYSGKLGLGWIAKEGTTATDVALITAGESTMPAAFSSKTGTLETSAVTLDPDGGTFNIVGNATTAVEGTISQITDFKMQIQRNNDGYWLRYLDAEGNVIGEKLFYDDNRNNLTQINKKDIHVGFVASRNARATFSNLVLTPIHPDDDAPATAKEITYVDPSYQILSSETSNSEDYGFIFYGNADGKLTIINDENEVVAQDVEYTAKQKYTVKTKLHEGDNKFVWAFVPTAGYAPGDYQQMSNYDKVVASYHVNYKNYAQNIIYVAPNGSASAAGTANAPTDIYSAVAYAHAGQKIYLAGGKYELNNVLIDRGHDGTADAPIYLMADPEAAERPVFDFSGQTQNTSAMILAGNYWYLKGFDVTYSANSQKGLQVSGSYNVVEDVDTYRNGNTGLQICRYLGTDKYADWPAYNTILNCTSYLNADAGYEDADGFAAKLTVGDGNKFVGCIAAYNADDGWDLFAKVQSGSIGAVTIDSSLAFMNGYVLGYAGENGEADRIDPNGNLLNAGNGNGFKMGGDSMSGHHVIKNSIAFANKAKGIDSNSCPDIEVYNCTSFDNKGYNVALYTNTAVNTAYVAQGVLSLKSNSGEPEQFKLLGTQNNAAVYSNSNYYFNGTKSLNASGAEASLSWFKNTDTAAAITGITRDANGSINMNGYLELTDAAPAGVGARLGSTAASDVLETVAEVSVFAANVTTLADVALPEELATEGYTWKYPETATKVFAGTTTEFIVSAEGKADKAVIVNFVEWTGLDFYATEQYLFGNDDITLNVVPTFTPAVDPSDIEDLGAANFKFAIAENSKLGLDTQMYEGANWMTVSRTEESKDGIAKFTATVTATLGGKSVKKTAKLEFTTRATAAYIDYSVSDGDVVEQTPVVVDIAQGDVLKLTATAVGLAKTDVKIAVNDTKVVKYDAKAGTLEAVGEGTATVTMTAASDKKVIAKMVVNVAGADLKTNVATMTLDRAKLTGIQFTALAMNGTTLVDKSVVVKSAVKGGRDYASDLVIENVVGNIYAITTKEDDSLSTGVYTLTLAGKVAAEGELVEFEPVTLKVVETKPTVTLKQTKKVNLFYTAGSVSNNGELKATSKLAGVTLTQTDADSADYKLSASKSGYNIVLKSNAKDAGKNKKITAVASFDGYKARYDKLVNITVASENKAPKLKLEVDNKVLYTQLGISDTEIRILDTTTNTYVTTADVALATSKPAFVKANQYFGLSKEGNAFVLVADKSGTAKISVQDADWTNEVVISQSISVNNSKPSVTVGKLTLNNTAAFVGMEQASAVMSVKNALDYKVRDLELTGTNPKSAEVLENLVYEVSVNKLGQNVLNVSFKDGANVKAGSYSFKATFGLNKLTAADLKPVTVKLTVVPKATVTTKQSGKIDLVDRLGSSVTLKPTLKNLNGTVVGVKLNDDASNQFNVVWNSAKGAAVVTAKAGIDLKKGVNYKVTPTYIVETNGGNVEVVDKAININPKQSTLKTTKLDILETRLSVPEIAARATFKATSPAKAEILDVVQVNGFENFAVSYDCESDTIAVEIVDAAGLKANATYSIKVQLMVEDAAVNAKAQAITLKVKVVK